MTHPRKLLVLALSLLGASAFAQTPPPPGRGPTDGPRQGPKGGPERRPQPDGGIRLLLNPKVRAELGLTDEQAAKIQALAPRPSAEGPLDGPGGPRPGGEPPRPPRDDAPKEGGPKGDAPKDGPEERLRAILTPEQAVRLRQIRLQREGARAIRRPDVAKELGLTDEQFAKLRPNPPMPPKEGEAPKPPASGERPDLKAEDARLLGMLTEEQRAKWRAMLGKPFDFGDEKAAEKAPAPSRA